MILSQVLSGDKKRVLYIFVCLQNVQVIERGGLCSPKSLLLLGSGVPHGSGVASSSGVALCGAQQTMQASHQGSLSSSLLRYLLEQSNIRGDKRNFCSQEEVAQANQFLLYRIQFKGQEDFLPRACA